MHARHIKDCNLLVVGHIPRLFHPSTTRFPRNLSYKDRTSPQTCPGRLKSEPRVTHFSHDCDIIPLNHFNRFKNVYLLAVSKFFVCSLAYNRVHMNRINSLSFRMLIENSSDGPEHMMHRLTQILTKMSSNQAQHSHPSRHS